MMNVGPKVFGEEEPDSDELNNCKNELFKNCLEHLEKQLEGKAYFCSD